MPYPVVFSKAEEAGAAVARAGQESRQEIYARLIQIETDEPTISSQVGRFVALLSEARPDLHFGIVSEDNDPERWVVDIYLPEEDRSGFLDRFSQTLEEFKGDGLAFNVLGRGEYPVEVLQAKAATS